MAFFTFLILSCALTMGAAVREKITPRMEIINIETNNTYVIYNKQPDMSTDAVLTMILGTIDNDKIKICTVGIWRFYTDLGFTEVNGTLFPFQVGTSEKYVCLNDIPNLEGMKSYRYLGPAPTLSSNCDNDLNQFSITVYEKENATGQEASFCLQEFQNVSDFTTLFTVNSYFMTGITDVDVTNQNTLAPVFQIFAEKELNPKSRKVCYALVNQVEENGVQERAKIYYRESLEAIGDEDPEEIPIQFGSLFFLKYSTILVNPDVCTNEIDGELIPLVKIPYVPPPTTTVTYINL